MVRPGAAAALPIAAGQPRRARRARAAGPHPQPTLVIWGRDDRWIDVSARGALPGRDPRLAAVVLDACGHMPQEERPADFARAVLAFLAGDAR